MQKIANHEDKMNVVSEMSPSEWVDFGYDLHGEYIHLYADREERELRCYRTVSEPGENERIKTTIEDVKFRCYWDSEYPVIDVQSDGTKARTDGTEVNYWYLTYMEAKTFMSFIDLMETTREGPLLFEWSEADGGTMMDDEATSMEAITMNYTKENGVSRHTQIRSEWQSAKSHLMAHIEGASY